MLASPWNVVATCCCSDVRIRPEHSDVRGVSKCEVLVCESGQVSEGHPTALSKGRGFQQGHNLDSSSSMHKSSSGSPPWASVLRNGGSLGGNGNSMFFGGARWQRQGIMLGRRIERPKGKVIVVVLIFLGEQQ